MYEKLLRKGLSFERLRTLIQISEKSSIFEAAGSSERAINFGRQIKDLESSFGMELIQRIGRRKMVNERGRELAKLARHIFKTLDGFCEDEREGAMLPVS